MSDRAKFLVGSVMLALAVGLLVGGFVLPRQLYSQEAGAEGRTRRFALVTGVPGVTRNSQTVYIVDDANEILYVFEYSSSAKDLRLRTATDIRRYGTELIRQRAKREERGRRKN